jgi:Mrp family chromosome partitioning ATPase
VSEEQRLERYRMDMHAPDANAVQAAVAYPYHGAPTPPPRSIVEIILHRKGTVLLWVLFALAIGGVYLVFAPPSYESRAEIVVLRANPEAPPSPLSSAGLSGSAPSTHAAMLLSTPVLNQALQDPAVADAAYLDDAEDPILYLRKKLRVGSSDDAETVTIRFEAGDPEAAAALITAVVNAYFEQQGLPVRGMADLPEDQPTASVIDEQVIASRLLLLSEEATRARIAADLARSRFDRGLAAGRDINQLQQLLKEAGADTQTLGLQNLASMSLELNRLDQVIQSLPPSWGPEHSRRVPIVNQYEALSERYYLSEQGIIRQAQATLESASTHAAAHRDRLEDELSALQAQAESARTMPVRVIDPPRVATRRSSPLPKPTLGIAAVLGLVLGVCFAVRAEIRSSDEADTTAREPRHWSIAETGEPKLLNRREDLERTASARDVPLLGMVPELSTGRRLTTPDFTSTAASIHQIRAVLQIQAHSQGTKSYAFTSTHRGAGKTSVAIGVASSLAKSGTRTLVIDCDLAGRIRRGQTGRPADPGHLSPFGPIDRNGSSPDNESLDDIAVGQGYLDQGNNGVAPTTLTDHVGIVGMLEGRSLEDCAVKATVEGLWLLPASGAETRHIGMLSDRFVRDLLDQARDRYDLVLFDTGPIPGSVEALLVTSQADGVVVVVAQGETGKALERTMSYLKVVSAKVIGTVFNHARATRPSDDSEPRSSTTPNGSWDHHDDGDIGRDIDDAMDEVPLGSGILAAAVFADEGSGFANDQWQLRGTSDDPPTKNGSGTKAHRQANGAAMNGGPGDAEHGSVDDILPPM